MEGPHCPLCDRDWDIKALRAHLREKLEKSKEAELVRDRLIESGRTVSAAIIRLRGLIDPLTKLPEVENELSTRLGQWSGGLLAFSESLASLDGVIAAKERLQSGWAAGHDNLVSELEATREKLKARPDKSAAAEARSFLVVAHERLNNVRTARRNAEEKKANASLGKIAYKTYCDVSEAALTKLYHEVEEEFGSYYRLINHDDEGEFKAKFEAAEGKLGLLSRFSCERNVSAGSLPQRRPSGRDGGLSLPCADEACSR